MNEYFQKQPRVREREHRQSHKITGKNRSGPCEKNAKQTEDKTGIKQTGQPEAGLVALYDVQDEEDGSCLFFDVVITGRNMTRAYSSVPVGFSRTTYSNWDVKFESRVVRSDIMTFIHSFIL